MTPIVLTAQVNADGILNVNVPLGSDQANRSVRVTVERIETPSEAAIENPYPLRHTPVRYELPTEPVAEEDWSAIQ